MHRRVELTLGQGDGLLFFDFGVQAALAGLLRELEVYGQVVELLWASSSTVSR